MRKVNLFIDGHLITHKQNLTPPLIRELSDIICNCPKSECDLSNAIIITGDVDVESIEVNGIVAVSGGYITD